MRSKNFKLRANKGAMLAEGVAALSVFLPIMFLVILVSLETSYAYTIKSAMSEAAREAARGLSVAYGKDPSIATSRSAQDTQVFSKVRIANMVADSSQFDNPDFQLGADPPVVVVTVRYHGNQHGLPPFPNPDPLGLGKNFQIVGQSSFRLK